MSTTEFNKVTSALQHLLVPVSTLKKHPENYRIGDVERIAESLIQFGQLKPIVVQQSTMTIVAGNHTFDAALGLGWTHIAAAVVEMEDDQARRFLIADNRLSDLAENDKTQLAKLLNEVIQGGGQMGLFGTGYDLDAVEDLAALAEGLEITPDEPFTGGYADGRPEAVVRDVETGEIEGEQKVPMREIVILVEVPDAALLGQRIRNLQKKYEGVTGITATILSAVATAHQHFYGTIDPTGIGEPEAVMVSTDAASAEA